MFQHAFQTNQFGNGHSGSIKDVSKTDWNSRIGDGTAQLNGTLGRGTSETAETDSSGTGGMRDALEGPGSAQNDAIHLKRRVGLFSGVALIVGTMIGSGIFVSPSGLLVRTGSIGVSFIIWMACGLLSLLGALAYAELGTMNTSSGAEWAYFMDAFGAWPAFLFSWVSTLVLKPSQMAIICLSFAQYAVEAFVSECDPPLSVVKMVAILAIVSILFVNCYSVNLGMAVQNVFTSAKLIAVLIVICGGAYKLCQGNTQHLQNAFSGTTPSLGAIATAFYTGLWAYDGWNNLNYVTEEIQNPSKNLPRSIIIGIPLVTLCYALINVSYLAAMSPTEMIESEAVAVTFGNRILGVMAWLMPLSVTISTFGSANGTLFAAGRLCFAASREGHLLDILSYVHVRRLTPAPGLIFHSLIAGAMVLYGTIDSLIDFFSFTAWIFYGGAMVALIVMRYTKPNYPRPYKVPLIIPILVMVISGYLVAAPIIEKPQIEYLYAVLFILAGLIFYVPFVHYGYHPKFMDNVTLFFQMLFEVVPTTSMAMFD
ncbi:b(0,+)-type amino acid transporter 1 isoform X2 [Anopheles merus]|uniref:b(0,+)-type amino acid transporter 1 isoform X2 n=1 Tax=Anopheles coluzzii TaxID=1518534 RepID=UPI001AAD82A5|nr:b(0,+)-type amino acid transporter 1 isoform X2 [Anopheles coluzzii]XP_041762547.1 b(0,+)-type amino acid transporter 1 isoform X2 [Anopheles merus]XP_061498887.1 b(0,+)-type amino acid transporter 1 isoform X2 [Anopheles gambiae]